MGSWFIDQIALINEVATQIGDAASLDAGILRLAKDQVMVSAICPGAFPSEMNLAARDHADALAGVIPSGRVGVDGDMAGTAIYLASRAGDYVNGTTVAVDGGVTLVNVSASMEV